MKIKRHYYPTSDSMVFSLVLFNKDVKEIQNSESKVYQVARESTNVVDALHALILVAKKIEAREEAFRKEQNSAKGY